MNDQHGKNRQENQDSPQTGPATRDADSASPGTTHPAGVDADQFNDAVKRKAQDDDDTADPPQEQDAPALEEDEDSIVRPGNS